MEAQIDTEKINAKIILMKQTAEELKEMGENFPALARNTIRIMAGIKMLEINISDVIDLNDMNNKELS